jgi:hypothetical protein
MRIPPTERKKQIDSLMPEIVKYYESHLDEPHLLDRMSKIFKTHQTTLRRRLGIGKPFSTPVTPSISTSLINLEDILVSGKYSQKQIFELFIDSIVHLYNERKSLEEEVLVQKNHILKIEEDLRNLSSRYNERKFNHLKLEKGRIVKND